MGPVGPYLRVPIPTSPPAPSCSDTFHFSHLSVNCVITQLKMEGNAKVWVDFYFIAPFTEGQTTVLSPGLCNVLCQCQMEVLQAGEVGTVPQSSEIPVSTQHFFSYIQTSRIIDPELFSMWPFKKEVSKSILKTETQATCQCFFLITLIFSTWLTWQLTIFITACLLLDIFLDCNHKVNNTLIYTNICHCFQHFVLTFPAQKQYEIYITLDGCRPGSTVLWYTHKNK